MCGGLVSDSAGYWGLSAVKMLLNGERMPGQEEGNGGNENMRATHEMRGCIQLRWGEAA